MKTHLRPLIAAVLAAAVPAQAKVSRQILGNLDSKTTMAISPA